MKSGLVHYRVKEHLGQGCIIIQSHTDVQSGGGEKRGMKENNPSFAQQAPEIKSHCYWQQCLPLSLIICKWIEVQYTEWFHAHQDLDNEVSGMIALSFL